MKRKIVDRPSGFEIAASLESFTSEYAYTGSPKTEAFYRNQLANLAAYLERAGAKLLADVTADMMRRRHLQDARKLLGPHPGIREPRKWGSCIPCAISVNVDVTRPREHSPRRFGPMPMRPPRDAARLQQQAMVGARMRKVREELAWNQSKAAEPIGFASPSAVSAIERGQNGIDAIDLYNYAQATGYPVAYFLDPDFSERAPAWPKTRMEWVNMAGGDTRKADAHWSLEQALATANATS